MDSVGNVSAYDLKRTDVAPASWNYTPRQTISFNFANGGTFGRWSSLTIFAGVSLGGLGVASCRLRRA